MNISKDSTGQPSSMNRWNPLTSLKTSETSKDLTSTLRKANSFRSTYTNPKKTFKSNSGLVTKYDFLYQNNNINFGLNIIKNVDNKSNRPYPALGALSCCKCTKKLTKISSRINTENFDEWVFWHTTPLENNMRHKYRIIIIKNKKIQEHRDIHPWNQQRVTL